MNADSLTGKDLDAWMYKHACQRLGKTPSNQVFEDAYGRGEFHFQGDPALLGELVTLHKINLHHIAEEWLAFQNGTGCYGATPAEAVCRWVVTVFLGKSLVS